MKKNNYIINNFVILLLLLSSCSDSLVDFGEQYKKTIYIVNSRGMLFNEQFQFSNEENLLNVSVYCAGTKPVENDVEVSLFVDEEALDSLNRINRLGNPLYVDKVILPKENYSLDNFNVTIKAGQQYGVLKIPITTKDIDVDTDYVLPLSIADNSKNYDVNEELKTIICEIEMINGFSGEYAGSSKELPSTIRSVQPVLKAMSPFSVRMPVHTLSSDVTFLDTNFMILTVDKDSTKVSIKPWKNAKVNDLGGSLYDKKVKSFNLNYTFIDDDGNEYAINEKINKLGGREKK